MTAIMLDLETMGNGPNAAIVAIGACYFDANGIGDTFYQVVSLESSVQCGGIMDAPTVLWWMGQSDAARRQFENPGVPIVESLLSFASWCDPDAEVWGNGAAFDNVILASAYRRTNLPIPWKFWNDRCYRTVKSRSSVPMPPRKGTAHNALDDAINQAYHLIAIDASVNNHHS